MQTTYFVWNVPSGWPKKIFKLSKTFHNIVRISSLLEGLEPKVGLSRVIFKMTPWQNDCIGTKKYKRNTFTFSYYKIEGVIVKMIHIPDTYFWLQSFQWWDSEIIMFLLATLDRTIQTKQFIYALSA